MTSCSHRATPLASLLTWVALLAIATQAVASVRYRRRAPSVHAATSRAERAISYFLPDCALNEWLVLRMRPAEVRRQCRGQRDRGRREAAACSTSRTAPMRARLPRALHRVIATHPPQSGRLPTLRLLLTCVRISSGGKRCG